MYETVLGRDGFRKGVDLYFERHDGTAVTCDDFLAAMADANGEDLSSLGLWYAFSPRCAVRASVKRTAGTVSCIYQVPVGHVGTCQDKWHTTCRYGQAGTPEVSIKTAHDAAAQTYTITITQKTPATKEQTEKVPVLIPVSVGLLGPSGAELPFTVTTGRHKQRSETTAVLLAEDATSTFVLSGVRERPVPSLLRDFSAPVNMTVEGQTDADLVFIMANDTDPVNRCAPELVQRRPKSPKTLEQGHLQVANASPRASALPACLRALRACVCPCQKRCWCRSHGVSRTARDLSWCADGMPHSGSESRCWCRYTLPPRQPAAPSTTPSSPLAASIAASLRRIVGFWWTQVLTAPPQQ